MKRIIRDLQQLLLVKEITKIIHLGGQFLNLVEKNLLLKIRQYYKLYPSSNFVTFSDSYTCENRNNTISRDKHDFSYTIKVDNIFLKIGLLGSSIIKLTRAK